MKAVISNRAENIELLLKTGVDINIKNKVSQCKLLHTFSRRFDFFKFRVSEHLSFRFGSIFVVCQYGETAFLLATGQRNIDLFQLMLKNGANVNDSDMVCVRFIHFHDAVECCSQICLVWLGFSFVKNGDTALMKVVRRNSAEIVELLLLAGANVNFKNRVCAVVVALVFYHSLSCLFDFLNILLRINRKPYFACYSDW